MKETFDNAIDLKIAEISQRLKKDSLTDWIENYSHKDMTPTELKELAGRYVTLFMAQEVQFNLTKTLLK